MKKKRPQWVEPQGLPEFHQGWRGEAWYNGDDYKGPVVILAIHRPKGKKATATAQFPKGNIQVVAVSRLRPMPTK